MIASGMVRKIDMLGRIVIPKEIRKNLKIDSGDDIEMFIENNCIVLKKFHALDNFTELAKSYCAAIYDNIHINCFICSKEKVIASSLSSREENISVALTKILKKGEKVLLNDNEVIPLFEKEDESKYKSQCISPIVCMGDVYGAVVAYSTKKQLTEKEADFIFNASLLLCGQLR
jgi:AbrB family transcriptional regulator (stage V sporulation protein T)